MRHQFLENVRFWARAAVWAFAVGFALHVAVVPLFRT